MINLRVQKTLAEVYRKKGLFSKSLVLNQQIIKSKRDIFQVNDHPEVLISMIDVANVLRNCGDYETSKSLFEECLVNCKVKLGLLHSITLECQLNYGNW
jgi:hypothetical protein